MTNIQLIIFKFRLAEKHFVSNAQIFAKKWFNLHSVRKYTNYTC